VPSSLGSAETPRSRDGLTLYPPTAGLQDFLDARGEELLQFSADSRARLEAETKRLAAEEERIGNELKHVEKEEGALKEEVRGSEARGRSLRGC
jgi:hypothetical protein